MIQLRVDDFPQTKGEPQHTLEAYRRFHRLLRDRTGGARYLLGIIPLRCAPEDWGYLTEIRDEIEPGVHGVAHDERQLDKYGNEFFPWLTGRSIALQLSNAMRMFHDASLRPVVYMPPRNVIDARTVSTLAELGFISFTGGPETELGFDPRLSYMRYIPSMPPHEYGRSDELLARGAVQHLRRLCSEGHEVTLALHWTWETNIGLEHLDRFLGELEGLFDAFRPY